MSRYALCVDQGTTGTFVGLLDESGTITHYADRPHRQIYPAPGWVEQDPLELWHNALDLMNQVVAQAKISTNEIAGVGIANQGESVVLWDAQTGQPLSNVIVWQDTRTQARIDWLAQDAATARDVARRTGLKLDSYFSASKIQWLLDNAPQGSSVDRLRCGTLDSWLIWKLTDGKAFVTDVSTASRTLLFNIHTLEWDSYLLDMFGVPAAILPQVLPSEGEFGLVAASELACQGVPIRVSLVDQPAAMIGQGCLNAGQIKATYGTGCFINLNTGAAPVASRHDLLTLLAWGRGAAATYGLDGGVFTAAASINWLRDQLGLLPSAEALDDLCAEASDSGGALWIPAQVGLGAPYWERSIRGAWLGIDLSTSKAQLARAVLEGIAANVAQSVSAMAADAQLAISSLRVDGGLTASRSMMQIQADLLGLPVEVVANAEATASGVGALTLRAAGVWSSDAQITRRVQIAQVYQPSISEDQRQAHLDRFNAAIRHLKAWHEHG